MPALATTESCMHAPACCCHRDVTEWKLQQGGRGQCPVCLLRGTQQHEACELPGGLCDCSTAHMRVGAPRTSRQLTAHPCVTSPSISSVILPLHQGNPLCVQETWGLLGADTDTEQTVVAVAIARLSEPALVTHQMSHGSFAGTGKALSVAAGRLSYTHGLKVQPGLLLCCSQLLEVGIWRRLCFARQQPCVHVPQCMQWYMSMCMVADGAEHWRIQATCL